MVIHYIKMDKTGTGIEIAADLIKGSFGLLTFLLVNKIIGSKDEITRKPDVAIVLLRPANGISMKEAENPPIAPPR